MPNAHSYAARAVDYNPNKPFHIVTGGEDRLVKFWDFRKPDTPLKVLLGHSHWVWTVSFNRFHDQLLLSGGTDAAGKHHATPQKLKHDCDLETMPLLAFNKAVVPKKAGAGTKAKTISD